jgi:FKBP12-rapamycin complex-associated protein
VQVFVIREVAISIIGRLAMRNPAYVMPSLRKTLIQLLTELQFSGETRHREESCRLLGHLIAAAHRLIKPYITPMLQVTFFSLHFQTHLSKYIFLSLHSL